MLMQQNLMIPIVSAVISVIAVTLSLITLWKTQLSKFKTISIVGDLGLRIYPIRGEEGRWFIPSFDVPISITNEGARPGKILGLRLKVSFPDLPIPDNKECFYPKWEVDGNRIGHDRFRWISEATVADWMPFVVLPKVTVTKHLVFESHWNDPVIQKRVNCVMEMYTDIKQEWAEVAMWELRLSSNMWSELVNKGSSFTFHPEGVLKKMEDKIHPPDLHKYTGTKEPIPDDGLGAGTTYLDYADDTPAHSDKPMKKRKPEGDE